MMPSRAWRLELKREYARSFGKKVAELRQLLEAARLAADDLHGARPLAEALQKMRGSAGSFTFGDASSIAGEAEDRLNGFLGQGLPPDEETLRSLGPLLDRLEASVVGERATSPGGAEPGSGGRRARKRARASSQLEVLTDIAKTARSTTDLTAAEAMVTSAAVHRLGAAFACVLSTGEGGYVVESVASRREGDEGSEPQVAPGAERLLAQVASLGQAVRFSKQKDGTSLVGSRQFGSGLAVPIGTDDSPRRILLIEKDGSPEISDGELHLYGAIADQLGLIATRILEEKGRLRLHEELRETQDRLQQSLSAGEQLRASIRRYLPPSAWDQALEDSSRDVADRIENLPEAAVLFADLVGFEAISEGATPEQTVGVLNTLFTRVSGIVAHAGGEVVKYAGGAVIAYLTRPKRAIEAADDILKARGRINREVAAVAPFPIDLRVGIAWGPVTICDVGPPHQRDRMLLGQTVNMAVRLGGAALAGTALLDPRLVPKGTSPKTFGLADAPPVVLRGRPHEVAVLTLSRDSEAYARRPQVAGIPEIASTPPFPPARLTPEELRERFFGGIRRYQYLETLGTGAAGVVYKVKDVDLNEVVALKVLTGVQDPEFLSRFKAELTLNRRIKHPNVARLFDFGRTPTHYYLTMELSHGRNLLKVLGESGAMPPSRAVPILRQIALGTHAGHEAGVIHRDLKPSNIMVDDGGAVAILDFGVARGDKDVRLTQQGFAMGTPHYMSPEQAHGDTLDGRSDVYTIGVLAFQMLTGQVPFDFDNPVDAAIAHAKAPVPVHALAEAKVPQDLMEIVRRCLEKRPEDRFPSAASLEAALAALRPYEALAPELPERAAAWIAPPTAPIPAVPKAEPATPKILVVDEGEDLRQLLAASLRAAGFDTVDASCGEDALQTLLEHEIALILMDVAMPGVDGFDATRILKSQQIFADIPVLLMSARWNRRQLSFALQAGAVDLLRKPVDPDALPARVRGILDLKREVQKEP